MKPVFQNNAADEGLFKKALRLEYLTVLYNLLEAILSIVAGRLSGSISLIGFGLDSIVESLSGFILIWRLKQHGSVSEEEENQIEERAVRFVGITFLLLALYVGIESVRKIVLKEVPDVSWLGIGIAFVSLLVMPLLARAKLKIGQALGLQSLIADSKETLVCAWLSLALLLGLLLNAAFGFWLADPLVGLIITGFLIKEGIEILFEEEDES